MRMVTSFSVDEIMLRRYVNWSLNFSEMTPYFTSSAQRVLSVLFGCLIDFKGMTTGLGLFYT